MEKQYSQNWFDRCIPVWKQHLACFKDKPDIHFLEVGSFEGRSACWLLDNILTHDSSTITCIDLFEDAGAQGKWSKELYDRYNMSECHERFLKNTEEYGDKICAHIGRSADILRYFVEDSGSYDCIYIDGSHIACDVLEDIILAWPLLKKDGLMILDDYEWNFWGDPLRHPKLAIDSFLSVFDGQYKILHKGYQIILRKTGRRED